MHFLGKTVSVFALLHSAYQGHICLLLQVFLDFLLLHSIFWVLVLKGLVGLHRTLDFIFFSITGRGIDLDYRDIEWFALEMNRDHSVVFEIASKYCILDSFADYDGYYISSKGFLPTVVDIMVIELNSPIPVHFSSLIPRMLMFTLAISFDHFQFALIHGPDIPGSYAILLFIASDLASITSHIHSWVLFLLWLHPSFFLELFLH